MNTATTTTPIYVTLILDAGLFKQQRKLLAEFICTSVDTSYITSKELEMLQGLENMCDCIADQAHDDYGLDTLYLDEDNQLI